MLFIFLVKELVVGPKRSGIDKKDRLDTKSTILSVRRRCRSVRFISRRSRDIYSIHSSLAPHDGRMFSATYLFAPIHTVNDECGHDRLL